MNNISIMIGVLLAGSALIPTAARAETREGFEAGIEVFDYSYRERLDGETIVFDDGTLSGINLSYVETIGSDLFLRAKLSAASGSVDYRSPDPAGDVRLEDIEQSVGQFEANIGIDLPLGGGVTLSPFTGLGVRLLLDDSGGEVSDNGFAGYDREVGFGYIPLGANLRLPIGGGGSALLIGAQYNFVFNGKARSDFSEIDADLPDVELNLDGGNGLEASAMYQMPLGKRAISVGPFVRHWKLNRSDSFILANSEDPTEALEFFEPRSRTTEIGIRLSFAF